jgi:PAS domain S-box-containing protein
MTLETLHAENEELRRRLEEAEETIRAIQNGDVDAFVVKESSGHQVYTLETADRPYRLFVEQMQQGAATLHADGTIVYCNRRLADMLKMPPEKLTGRAFGDCIAAEDQSIYENLLWQGQRQSGQGEARLRRADDGLVPVYLTFNALPKDCGMVIGVLITDLTSQRHHEQLTAAHNALRESEGQLRRGKDDLEARVEERTRELVGSQERLLELASQLSLTEERERRKLARNLHDYLAQMLVVGRMKLSQAKKQLGLSTPNHRLVQDVEEVFQRALDYTRTLIAELTPPSLHEYGLPEALRWLGERFRKDGLYIEVQSNPEKLPLSEEQAILVFQSVRELLFNVLKHSGVDRAIVTLTITPSNELRVTVADQGKGMGMDMLQRPAGLGHLGLFSVRERMEALGGRLEFESSPGRTHATIVLPFQGMSKELHTPPGIDQLQSSRIRVLLVDDHAMVRQGLRSLLEQHEPIAIVGEAGDGEEAVALAAQLSPDVILMDINMPKMDGVRATRHINKTQPGSLIIGLTIDDAKHIQDAMLEAGASACLSKDTLTEELYHAIVTARQQAIS